MGEEENGKEILWSVLWFLVLYSSAWIHIFLNFSASVLDVGKQLGIVEKPTSPKKSQIENWLKTENKATYLSLICIIQ